MTKHNLTYAITLIVACTAILAPHAVAHLTVGDILGLPFSGIGVPNLSKCLAVISEVPGCLEELISSVLSIQPRLLGPTCCNALLQVDQNCWPRLLPRDPASPSHLQEYCVELQSLSQERAPPMPHPPPLPPLARSPPPPPPLAHTPPPPPLPIRAQALPPLSLLPIREEAPPPLSLPPIKAQAPPPLSRLLRRAQAPLPPPPPPSPLLQVLPPPSSLPPLPGCPTTAVPSPMSNPDDYDYY